MTMDSKQKTRAAELCELGNTQRETALIFGAHAATIERLLQRPE